MKRKCNTEEQILSMRQEYEPPVFMPAIPWRENNVCIENLTEEFCEYVPELNWLTSISDVRSPVEILRRNFKRAKPNRQLVRHSAVFSQSMFADSLLVRSKSNSGEKGYGQRDRWERVFKKVFPGFETLAGLLKVLLRKQANLIPKIPGPDRTLGQGWFL